MIIQCPQIFHVSKALGGFGGYTSVEPDWSIQGPLRSCLSPVLPEEMAEDLMVFRCTWEAKLFQSDVQILLILEHCEIL